MIKFQTVYTILKLLHLHLVDKLPRHKIPLGLLLCFVLKMAANYVKDLILQGKAVAKTSFIAHRRDKHVLALSDLVGTDSAHVLRQRLLDEAD